MAHKERHVRAVAGDTVQGILEGVAGLRKPHAVRSA